MRKHLILAGLLVGALVPFAAFGCGDSDDAEDGSGGGSDALQRALPGSDSWIILRIDFGKTPGQPKQSADDGSGMNPPAGDSDREPA
jgi:hypothetical protein